MLSKCEVVQLKIISQFSKTEVEGLDLYIALVNDEYKSSVVGILKNKEKILEYCQTIDFPKNSFIKTIYEKLRFYQVFPSHFYNVIDDK